MNNYKSTENRTKYKEVIKFVNPLIPEFTAEYSDLIIVNGDLRGANIPTDKKQEAELAKDRIVTDYINPIVKNIDIASDLEINVTDLLDTHPKIANSDLRLATFQVVTVEITCNNAKNGFDKNKILSVFYGIRDELMNRLNMSILSTNVVSEEYTRYTKQ